MSQKKISPAAINALKEALVNVYWYKSDLQSFLMNTISNPEILSRFNWGEYKRNIVTSLIELFSKNQDRYQNDLLKLMSEVIKIEDYSHLMRLDDGKEKAKKAEESIKALRKLVQGHFEIIDEQKEIEERRKKAFEKRLQNQGVYKKLEDLKSNYFQLLRESNMQKRGYALEKIIKELFTLFDLDPKASFKIQGEQIDGAFTFENIDYLFEGKWQKEQIRIQELDAFSGKLSRKLDNTLGLYLSVNGYSEDAIKAHSTGRRLMILMDGSDLMAVVEGRIDLLQLLLRKRRHASQTGNIYLRIHEILIEN